MNKIGTKIKKFLFHSQTIYKIDIKVYTPKRNRKSVIKYGTVWKQSSERIRRTQTRQEEEV